MVNEYFHKPNKTDRGIIRSTENGHFRKAENIMEIPPFLKTGPREPDAKRRNKRGGTIIPRSEGHIRDEEKVGLGNNARP